MSEKKTSEPKLEKIKYRLLKLVDISGFRVFDPVVRLFFGEEPRKQTSEILKYMVTPMIFVAICVGLWMFIAPRHKTKSGEVPTPAQVWDALIINDTLSDREFEKDRDFLSTGEDREQRIAQVKTLLEEKEIESKELKAELVEVELAAKDEIAASVGPLEKELDDLKAANKEAEVKRKESISKLAEQVSAKTIAAEELLATIRQSNEQKDLEKETEKTVKEQIKEIAPPKSVKKAQLASNSVANEVQYLQKRLDYLETANRAVKVESAEEKAAAAMGKLEEAESPAAILAAARSVIRGEKTAERTAEQQYARTPTIWFQVQRSLFTVFIGFVLAAMIAIPIGIMCGLNKVVMACLTPIISVFKPVSPVVWLLLFQIVVGAFFPDPATHPLFVFAGSLPFIGDLGVNPAMVFSACTVAMCALWPALVNTALGVSSIEQDHLNVAKVLRLNLWSRLTKIVIPASLPLVFAGLRISLGVGWMVLIAAEALSSSEGLGKFVWDEYQNGSSHSFANILLACFVVGLIGFFLDRIMILLQRSVSFDDGAAIV